VCEVFKLHHQCRLNVTFQAQPVFDMGDDGLIEASVDCP